MGLLTSIELACNVACNVDEVGRQPTVVGSLTHGGGVDFPKCE